MNAALLDSLNKFAGDLSLCASAFRTSYSSQYLASAVIHHSYGVSVDSSRLETCKRLLKDNVKVFNPLRGLDMPIIASYMAVHNSPAEYLNRAVDVQNLFKEQFPWHSTTLPTAIALEMVPIEQTALKIKISRSICDVVSQKHPMTSKNDKLALYLMMSMVEDANLSIIDAEQCCQLLKPIFHGNSLSIGLAMSLDSGSSQSKCSKAIELYTRLKQQGIPYSLTYEAACLGILAISNADTDTLASDIAEAAAWMAADGRFGLKHGLTKAYRTTLAGHLVLQHYANRHPDDTHLSGCAVLSGYALLLSASLRAIAAASNN